MNRFFVRIGLILIATSSAFAEPGARGGSSGPGRGPERPGPARPGEHTTPAGGAHHATGSGTHGTEARPSGRATAETRAAMPAGVTAEHIGTVTQRVYDMGVRNAPTGFYLHEIVVEPTGRSRDIVFIYKNEAGQTRYYMPAGASGFLQGFDRYAMRSTFSRGTQSFPGLILYRGRGERPHTAYSPEQSSNLVAAITLHLASEHQQTNPALANWFANPALIQNVDLIQTPTGPVLRVRHATGVVAEISGEAARQVAQNSGLPPAALHGLSPGAVRALYASEATMSLSDVPGGSHLRQQLRLTSNAMWSSRLHETNTSQPFTIRLDPSTGLPSLTGTPTNVTATFTFNPHTKTTTRTVTFDPTNRFPPGEVHETNRNILLAVMGWSPD